MKHLIIAASILILASCKPTHKFQQGDVVQYKVYANQVLILDTFSIKGQLWYHVEDPKCPKCTEVAEYEIEEVW